jgi:hypothetical protein
MVTNDCKREWYLVRRLRAEGSCEEGEGGGTW